MSGNVRLTGVQPMALRRELNEFGVKAQRIVKCSGIDGHDLRRVTRCTEQQAAATRAEIARGWHAAAANHRISLDFAFE